ncbi:MAG: c-di-GMP-binding flagellar brake protein YcgR [Pseudohongiellaceae bacterium]|jgi:c-di-GMP-binding flagellar brake protein YcgR
MRFEELKLSIGTTFDLTIIGQDYKRHSCKASLMGYQKNCHVWIELINKPPQVLLHQGLKIEGTISNALGFAEFESEIDDLDQSSSPYIVLDYPVNIRFNELRKEPRFPVDEPVEIIGKTAMGMDTSAMHGYVLDVSCSGARVVVEKELTKMVTQASVGVKLSIPGLERDMTLMAKVRKESKKDESHPEYGFAYGLKFIDFSKIDQYFIQAFCYRMELQARQLLCKE